ncbi:MAG: hypothetical protein KDA24_13505 [Deltaproteobacteria bacterium]|nr:hypothetical protein [Deltaproteobacteria bacterium]
MDRILPCLLLLLVGCSSSYHPPGFDDGTTHGDELKEGRDDCRTCHGDNLDGTGTSSVSCDQCHVDGWREDCTYCHGGQDDDSGAPPRDLDGTTAAADTSFPPHTAHTSGSLHAPYDCVMCHVQPDDVLSVGHIFDSTPARSEVDFSGGIAPDASWDGLACSNNYCHGDGRIPGQVDATDGEQDCESCHAPPTTSGEIAAMLSGEHREHVVHQVECADCHPNVNVAGDLTNPTPHVDGQVALDMPNKITVDDGGRCTGTCHNEDHNDESW